jgi:hypothetical protein
VNKLIPIVVALVVALAAVGCGGDDEASPSTATDTETVTLPTETETETETETTTQPTETTTAPKPETPVTIRITVRDGRTVGGIARPKVKKDDRVVLIVTSDVADEVHLHGYDLSRDVAPGQPARIAFRATIPGRFEVELEERGVQIAELTVTP